MLEKQENKIMHAASFSTNQIGLSTPNINRMDLG